MIGILVVDDDPLVRSALTLMLGGQPDLEVLGEAADGREALRLVAELRPAVVLMDIRMPVMDGLEATREIHRAPGRPPGVIVLTTFDADEYVVSAVAAGAQGFLLKDTAPAEIVAAVRAVHDGEPMLSPTAATALIRRVRSSAEDTRATRAARALTSLTERELEVADAVARGLANAEIARELHMSIPTVKAHVSRIFDKLQVNNRVQIAVTVHLSGRI